MHTNAINTVEVRFTEAPDDFFERRLCAYQERFEAEPGCLGFSISRSTQEPQLWLLTGHWACPDRMTEHFDADNMTELVNMLVLMRASLSFASFSKVVSERALDVH